MSVAIITGSSGLIGSEAAVFFHSKGFQVVGIDNNLREFFFGPDGSTLKNQEALAKRLKAGYQHEAIDIRDAAAIEKIFQRYGSSISVVIHSAAQPSHDWSAKDPATDFSINAQGSLVMLEATRKFAPNAVFLFTSTNKVYGDSPNFLPLVEMETRWELESSHPYHRFGFDEKLSIDQTTHGPFGASKLAADIMTQEYARYFGLKTGVFRGGCLTGPSHAGAELQGFLSYLVKCVMSGRKYTVYGHKGKQVRDNIHALDFVSALWRFFEKPKPGAVYNLGGSRKNSCSVLEAIAMAEQISGKRLNYALIDTPRLGDHIWWISDVRKFQTEFPGWDLQKGIKEIVEEMVLSTNV